MKENLIKKLQLCGVMEALEKIRKAANRYGIKVSDRKKLRKCEYCGKEHDGSFGSGRFCCSDCAKKYSLSFSKGKNQKINLLKKKK